MLAMLLVLLAADPLANITPAEIQKGQQLFRANCAPCHGIDGGGGAGPSLHRAALLHAPDNEALIGLITGGIPDTGMPASWHLMPDGPRLVAGYVRTLGQVSDPPPRGDAAHGREVYRASGCARCHIAAGEGTGIGPELSEIGMRRTAAALRRAIVDPAAALPPGFMTVRAQRADGSEVRGMRVNEDTFTIQVKDAGGRFHSLVKAELKELEKRPAALMPAFAASITGSDLDDLVAYLAGLRGAQP